MASVIAHELEESATDPEDTVVRQSPEPGDELSESRRIKVEIATRPWINYLPGIYQDADEENADFLRRFLLISAHLICGIEESLEFVHELFDARLTNAKWLPWLASWLAMPLLEGWSEEKRREIIQRTPELYRKRGTAEGLKLALVVSRFNSMITERLLDGALDCLRRHGARENATAAGAGSRRGRCPDARLAPTKPRRRPRRSSERRSSRPGTSATSTRRSSGRRSSG